MRTDPSDNGGLFVGRRPGTAPVRFRALPKRGSDARQRVDGSLAGTLLAGMIVLSLLCWGPIPIACLWVGSEVNYLTGSVSLGILLAFAALFALLFGALALLRRMDNAWILVRRAAGLFGRKIPKRAVERVARRAGRHGRLQAFAIKPAGNVRGHRLDRGRHALDRLAVARIGHAFAPPAMAAVGELGDHDHGFGLGAAADGERAGDRPALHTDGKGEGTHREVESARPANSVHSLPRLRGRVGRGKGSLIMHAPSLSLPRKRGRGRCGMVHRSAVGSTSPETALKENAVEQEP